MATKKTTKAKAKASVRVNVNVNSKNRKVVRSRQHFPIPYPTALPPVRVEVHSSTPQQPIAIHQPPMMRDTHHPVGIKAEVGTQTPQVAEEVHPLPLRVYTSPTPSSSASSHAPSFSSASPASSTRHSSASSHASSSRSTQPHPQQVPPSRNFTREAINYGTSLAQSAVPKVLEMGAGAAGTVARGALSIAPPLARMGAGALQSAVPAVAGMANGLYQYATREPSRHSSVASSTHSSATAPLVPTSTRFQSPPPVTEPRRGTRVSKPARQYSPSGEDYLRPTYR